MQTVFISYSSADQSFAKKLAHDLDNSGVGVWFDKWEILVGDSIVSKINQGIQKNDFLAVIISPDSISSSWVEKELNAALMRELSERSVVVLPILYRDCDIPPLLIDKRYADFRLNYRSGLNELLQAILPEMFVERMKRHTGEIVGIDFGTSNSIVSVIEDGRPAIVLNREGNRTTPSVVALTSSGKWIVGLPAVLQAETNPVQTFFSIKGKFGTDFSVVLNGKSYRCYDLAAKIFHKLREDSELYLGKEVRRAVLTCPAHFSQRQRKDIRRSAELGGFEIVRLVAEPTAAILAYGLHKKLQETTWDYVVVVYDLGGGSFDVSIANPYDGIVEVHSVWGDTHLGGDDFDHQLLNYCLDSFEKEYGIIIRNNPIIVRRVLSEVEKAKIILSATSSAKVFVPYVGLKEGYEPLHLDVTITLAIFESLTKDLVNRTIECCEKAMYDFLTPPSLQTDDEKEPSFDVSKVKQIILCGLSTKIPLVRQRVREFFGRNPICKVDPDEVVALGAAVQADVIECLESDTLLLDCIPFSIGIELSDGSFSPIIERQTVIPYKVIEIFTAIGAPEKGIVINVFEGEEKSCSKNCYLGTLVIRPLPGSSDTIEIEVALDIDTNGFIHITATEKYFGTVEKLTVNQYTFQLEPPAGADSNIRIIDNDKQ